jgi:hypothetical protein
MGEDGQEVEIVACGMFEDLGRSVFCVCDLEVCGRGGDGELSVWRLGWKVEWCLEFLAAGGDRNWTVRKYTLE